MKRLWVVAILLAPVFMTHDRLPPKLQPKGAIMVAAVTHLPVECPWPGVWTLLCNPGARE